MPPWTRARACVILACVLLSLRCNKSSGTETTPTPMLPSGGLSISSLQARQVGLIHDVCGVPFEYTAIDELTFDVNVTNAAAVVGGTVIHQESGKAPEVIGVVQQCSATQQGCSSANVCLVSTSPTRIRVSTRVGWTPQRAWHISLLTTSALSNALDAVIQRPDQLPTGNLAGIAHLSAVRSSGNMGTYRIVAYSPGVGGRQIVITREVYSGSSLISTSTVAIDEAPDRNLEVDFGSLTLPPGNLTVVATVQEFDGSGAGLMKETKSIIVQ